VFESKQRTLHGLQLSGSLADPILGVALWWNTVSFNTSLKGQSVQHHATYRSSEQNSFGQDYSFFYYLLFSYMFCCFQDPFFVNGLPWFCWEQARASLGVAPACWIQKQETALLRCLRDSQGWRGLRCVLQDSPTQHSWLVDDQPLLDRPGDKELPGDGSDYSFIRHPFITYGLPWAQLVKNLPAMWETWVQSLGWEDPLEKGTATHSSVLAWRIPWTIQSIRSDTSEQL